MHHHEQIHLSDRKNAVQSISETLSFLQYNWPSHYAQSHPKYKDLVQDLTRHERRSKFAAVAGFILAVIVMSLCVTASALGSEVNPLVPAMAFSPMTLGFSVIFALKCMDDYMQKFQAKILKDHGIHTYLLKPKSGPISYTVDVDDIHAKISLALSETNLQTRFINLFTSLYQSAQELDKESPEKLRTWNSLLKLASSYKLLSIQEQENLLLRLSNLEKSSQFAPIEDLSLTVQTTAC